MPASAAKLLIIDADAPAAQSLASFFTSDGHSVTIAATAAHALELLTAADNTFDCILTELSLPDMPGMDLLRTLAKQHRATAVIVTTAYGSVESAVESLRTGACDYLVKPFVDGELRQALDRALRERALRSENVALRNRLDRKHNLANIAGSDPRMRKVFELVRAVAPSRTTVMMTGESGTGKSLIAHAIHQHSPRNSKPFVEISCGSIPETLLESELFGHVKGAFTGAHADKVGRFLAANGGTIFISDIPEMARFFLAKHAQELSRQIVDFDPAAMTALQRYTFPGNVRELQNIIERAAVLTQGQIITLQDLPDHVIAAREPSAQPLTLIDTSDDAAPWVPQSLEAALREPERRIIRKALIANDWNRQKTSEQLGINRTTLYKKMKALGMLDDTQQDRPSPRMAG